jgi:hypothetical protein
VGKPDDFNFGCPDCGLALAANPNPEPFRPAPVAAPPPPWWGYAAAGLVLLGLVLILLNSLR